MHFEDCGVLTELLLDRNIAIRYIDVRRHDLCDIDVSTADILTSLGRPVGVYDTDVYSWIRDELDLFERFLALNRPLLGLCLGSQMLARVLGARLSRAPCSRFSAIQRFKRATSSAGWSPRLRNRSHARRHRRTTPQ